MTEKYRKQQLGKLIIYREEPISEEANLVRLMGIVESTKALATMGDLTQPETEVVYREIIAAEERIRTLAEIFPSRKNEWVIYQRESGLLEQPFDVFWETRIVPDIDH